MGIVSVVNYDQTICKRAAVAGGTPAPTIRDAAPALAEFVRAKTSRCQQSRAAGGAEARTDRRPVSVQLQAARGEGALGPVCHQTGRCQESAERGVVRPLPSCPAGARRKRVTQLRQAEYHSDRADGCGEDLPDSLRGGLDRGAVRQGGRDEVLGDRLRRRRRRGHGARFGPARRRRREARAIWDHLHR